MSIVLTSVASGYNISAVNTAFSTIQSYINDNMLHRAGSTAGDSTMERDLDMNGYRILNADLSVSSITNDRAIRVPVYEGYIPALPSADIRKGKILTFDPVTGLPIVTAPLSGSAVDVLNQLALGTGSQLVKYTYPTTGTPLTLESKLSQELNVKDFGAKGDFATDDTLAIKRALVAAAAYSNRGAVVVFPAGIYNVSASLEVPEYVKLKGAGRFSTLIRCTTTGDVTNPVVLMEESFSALEGIGVVYSSLQTTSGTCIRTTGASNTLTDFSVSSGFIGVEWYEGSATKMYNFEVTDCKSVGVQLGKDNVSFSNDLIMDKFFILSGDSSNFTFGAIRALGRLEAMFISNFDLIGNTYPFTSDAGTTEGLRFSNFTNGFFDSGLNPCQFANVNNTTFTDCWWSQRAAGAQWSACFNVDIKGARVYNNTAQGFIFINACRQMNVSGTFANNNVGNASGIQDIYVEGTCYAMNFHDLLGYESGNTNYLILLQTGGINHTVRNVRTSARSAGIVGLGASLPGLILNDIVGFTTRNKGSSSLPSGATTVAVPHSLAITPTMASIRIQQNGATATPLYVSSVNATTFTVQTAASNVGTSPFSWEVDMTQV